MISNNWPQQPQDDLRIDTAWRENYSGASMNRKFAGVVPPGIYNGFKVVVDEDTPLTVLVGDVDESIAVVESQGFSLTARMPAGMKKSLTLKAGATQHILLQVDYQQQKVSTVELIATPDLLPNSVLLATLKVPSNADRLTVEMIDYSQRIDRITVLDHEQKADPHSQYYPKTGGEVNGNIWCRGKITADNGLHFNNKALISASSATDNFDHIWHDDGNGSVNTDLHGAWHFCSDAPELRSPGNSRIQAGSYSLAHKGKLTHLKTGDAFSGYAASGLTVVTEHGKSSMGMADPSHCHFATEAEDFYFDKNVVVKGEFYAGSRYNKRVFHEGDQTDAINDSSSNKLATAKAVKTAYDKANAALPKSGGIMTGIINCATGLNNGRHALNLHNSDVIGINALFCEDVSQAKLEGLVFPKEDNLRFTANMSLSNWMSLRCYNNHALFWDGTADRKLYHEGFKPTKNDVGLGNLPNAKTDAINQDNPNILATAKAVKTAYDKALEDAIKPGMIMMWAGATNQIPTGWALCNGQGKTSNGFAVPDLRDRFIVGAGKSYNPSSKGGENSKNTTAAGNHNHTITVRGHVLTVAQMPSHTHPTPQGDSAKDTNHRRTYTSGDDWTSHVQSWPASKPTGGNQAHAHGASSSNAGNHQHKVDVRPPFYALCFIIKI